MDKKISAALIAMLFVLGIVLFQCLPTSQWATTLATTRSAQTTLIHTSKDWLATCFRVAVSSLLARRAGTLVPGRILAISLLGLTGRAE